MPPKKDYPASGLAILSVARRVTRGERFTVDNFVRCDPSYFTVRSFYKLRDFFVDGEMMERVNQEEPSEGFKWTVYGLVVLRDIIREHSPPPHSPTKG